MPKIILMIINPKAYKLAFGKNVTNYGDDWEGDYDHSTYGTN